MLGAETVDAARVDGAAQVLVHLLVRVLQLVVVPEAEPTGCENASCVVQATSAQSRIWDLGWDRLGCHAKWNFNLNFTARTENFGRVSFFSKCVLCIAHLWSIPGVLSPVTPSLRRCDGTLPLETGLRPGLVRFV